MAVDVEVQHLLQCAPMTRRPRPEKEPEELDFVRLSEVDAEAPQFLVEPFVPLGAITLLEGDPAAAVRRRCDRRIAQHAAPTLARAVSGQPGFQFQVLRIGNH